MVFLVDTVSPAMAAYSGLLFSQEAEEKAGPTFSSHE